MEPRGPEAMGEHRRSRGVRPVVPLIQEPSQHGMQTHHVEVRAADDARANLSRLAEADHGESNLRKVPDAYHGFHAAAEVQNLGH